MYEKALFRGLFRAVFFYKKPPKIFGGVYCRVLFKRIYVKLA